MTDCLHTCCDRRDLLGHLHVDTPAACPDCERRSGNVSDAARDLLRRIFVAQGSEPVMVIADALIADVEPMLPFARAQFILDALKAAGYELTKSQRTPRADDRPGAGHGPAAVDPLPVASPDEWGVATV